MCGIVGAVAARDIVPVLLEGLRKLEYRGYDSAGLAVINDGLQRLRSVGRVSVLADMAQRADASGKLGIAHTRWATHGVPNERNAHPHVSHDGLAIVHNGIIENYESIRARLVAAGYVFDSDTDTEVVAHLVHSHLRAVPSLFDAVQNAVAELEGAFAIAVLAEQLPDRLVVSTARMTMQIRGGNGRWAGDIIP